MPPTNTPAQVPQERNEQASAERKERLHVGDRERKFVIKLSLPIPT